MNPRAVTVLQLPAEIESGEETVTTFLGGGRTETVSRPHAEVTELLLEKGIVEIRHGDSLARLHFDEADLLEFTADAGDDAEKAWGERLPDEVAAARFLSIQVDESLATREPHESGWWTWRPGGFDPVPPWQHRRHTP